MSSRTTTASVVLITYNHRAFIAQALDSVVSQQTNFPVDVIVADDASKDGTADIIRDYAGKHPDKLKAVLRSQNLGMHGNFSDALSRASGKYIALLEGDDYWTDPLKLQKQVAFMEASPQCSGCFTDAWFLNDETGQKHLYHPPGQNSLYTFEALLRGNVVPCCTTLLRRALLPELPAWVWDVISLDWALHLLATQSGSYAYLPGPTAVYRQHAGGLWASTKASKQRFRDLAFYDTLRTVFGQTHGKELTAARSTALARLITALGEEDDLPTARQHLWKL